jgi:hypothetical protein
MPDICMCNNEECYCKETCYRYRAIPDPHWQSYSTFPTPIATECEHYDRVRENDIVRPLPTK